MTTRYRLPVKLTCALLGLLTLVLGIVPAVAQTTIFPSVQSNITSNVAGTAFQTNPNIL